MPRQDVGHAGQVAQHVVAVEAQQRQQLLQDHDVLHEGDHEQRFLAGREIGRAGGQGEDAVEVDAAEIGPQPARAVEPVGVRHVAVERRPDEVEPDAHHAGPRAAVAARARVSAFVPRVAATTVDASTANSSAGS